jgi:ferritin-like metal-binding protein YciE
MAEPNTRDSKLIQYLNEAYGKEKELETALEAHIPIAASRKPYQKRLRDHLKETKGHGRELSKRIKQLGGKAEAGPLPGAAPEGLAEAAARVQEVASKGLAAAKGPLHVLRGTGEAEKMLKNAKTEYFNEFEEIATYHAIQNLAETVGDADTAKLAKAIRREEERMAKFLERQIAVLAKAVAAEEIPAAEWNRPTRRRRSTASRNGGSARTTSGAARSRASSSARKASSSAAKKTSARKPAAPRARTKRSS